jgi:hypothetical protein
MSQAVKISDTEMDALREAAALQSRSISGQAEHWMRLGRAFERDERFGFAKVEQALKGLLAPMELSAEQQEDYFDRLEAMQLTSTVTEEEFFADRRRRGVGVGMDDAGNIVRQTPGRT